MLERDFVSPIALSIGKTLLLACLFPIANAIGDTNSSKHGYVQPILVSMEWNQYKEEFNNTAKELFGYSEEQRNKLLAYAYKLYQNKVPIIYTQEHFADIVGYKYELLLRITHAPSQFYRKFKIAKKCGGDREICEPLPSLKEIQRWIVVNIIGTIPTHPVAKAYRFNTSVRDNARFHINQKIVMKLDILDYFGSVKEYLVYRVFREIGYSKSLSVLFTKLCCLNNSLPQGAPTSPALSNIVMRNVDANIFSFARINKIRFTRYADDFTFSGSFPPNAVKRFVSHELEVLGLSINNRKTCVITGNRRQEITGIVVNKKLQVNRTKRMYLRQQVYYIKRYGIQSVAERNGNVSIYSFLNHLIGVAGFIRFINPRDPVIRDTIKYLQGIRESVIR